MAVVVGAGVASSPGVAAADGSVSSPPSLGLPLPPEAVYLPKNGCELNGVLGGGKSPQNLPFAFVMYSPQISAGNVPPATLAP